jgi:predicted aldo/keto reductase-like oxidoreductase
MESKMAEKKLTRRLFLRDLMVTCACSGLYINTLAVRHALGKTPESPASGEPINMEYRPLGRTGLKVSAISFGVMRVTEPAVLLKALGMGINYFDTAHGYQGGNSEKMLGKVLRQYGREKAFIATKIPPYYRFLGMKRLDEPTSMEEKMEESLRRLQTDYVDVLFLHGVSDPDLPDSEEMLGFCEKMKKAGKARFVGISLHEAGQTYVDIVDRALKTDKYDVLLATLNYMSPPEHIEALKRARNKNVGIVAMKTQAGGYNQKTGGSLNPHQAALKWTLDCEFVDCAIPGMVNMDQVVENCGVVGKKTGWRDKNILTAYYEAVKDRLCTRCGACHSSCQKAVDIPTIHRALMYWEGYEDFELGRTAYRELAAKDNAMQCMDCSEPTCRCMNGLKIPQRMRIAHTAFA